MTDKRIDSFQLGDLIYRNPLSTAADVADFHLEGQAHITFPNGRMRLANALDPIEGQRANFVLWCQTEFPSDVAVSWDFWPLHEPGLCMLFFAARGRSGQDILDPDLDERAGEYQQYHHGEINTFHVSYFRRKLRGERAFHTCNLRKSYGFHLVASGADPIPDVDDADPPYHILLVKVGASISFSINGLRTFNWVDDGERYGPPLGGGKIGFRQMAPLIAEYDNFEVYEVKDA